MRVCLSLLGLLVVVAGAGAVPASAATVTAVITCCSTKVDDTLVDITAAPGERNKIVVAELANGVRRVSDVVPITPGVGCQAAPGFRPAGFVVECRTIGSVFTTVNAGDGDDYVRTGPDRDRLRGGSGNDLLDGGGGRDELYGETGDDFLRISADGRAHLLGGPGADLLRGLLTRPLGTIEGFLAKPAPYPADRARFDCGDDAGDRVVGVRFGDTTSGCPVVDEFRGLPRERARHLLVRVGCRDPAGTSRGRCDTRLQVAGRRAGSLKATIAAGTVRTLRVPVDQPRVGRKLYSLRLAQSISTTKGRAQLRAGWTTAPAR